MKPKNCRDIHCKYYAEDRSSGKKLFARKKQIFCHCLDKGDLVRNIKKCRIYKEELSVLREG